MADIDHELAVVFQEIESLEDALGVKEIEGTAKKWWATFRKDEIDRPKLIRTVLRELDKRDATISELFHSYIFSLSDNIQVNLEFLDHAIETYRGARPISIEHFERLRM